jgi:hypothetical protein
MPTTPKKPSYAWQCCACRSSNDAGVERCVGCGLDAYSKGKTIAQRAARLRPPAPATTPPPAPNPESRLTGSDWLLFFPEGILAAITVLSLPVWVGRLLRDGAHGAAASLLALSGVGVTLSVIAWRNKNKWEVYAGMMFILLGAWSAV